MARAVVGGCPTATGVVAVTSPSPHSTATDVGIAVIGATVAAAVGGGSIDTRSAAIGGRSVRLMADSAGTTNMGTWIVSRSTATLRSAACYTSDAALAADVCSCVVGVSVAAACVRAVSTGDDAVPAECHGKKRRQVTSDRARLCKFCINAMRH